MGQDNEKIIYDIEIRTKIDEAQQELRKLKQELKNNNKEELLVNLKFVGTENFNSIKQNLSEVRKAIEVLEKHNSTTLTLNGAGFDITLNKLRALEKELEDFQAQVNKGNLNNQIKEQQKLQNELEKTVSKFNKLKETFNTSFNTNKALSEKELNSMIKQANDYAEKINTIYKQMGMNMKVVNPFDKYSGDYSKYFTQSKEKSIQELKQIEDAKVKQAKQANAQIIKDEQEAISKNTQAHQSAWQTIVSIEKEKEAQYKKINQLLEQRKKIIDDIAISLRSNKAFNENQFNNKVNNSNKIINDLSSLGVHTSNPMHQFNNYDDYINKSNQKVLEQQKLSKTRAKQELNNQLLLAKAEEDKQKAQAEQTEKNKKALDNYYKEEEQRIKQNSNSHKQAYQEWNKSELEKEKITEQNKKNLDKFYKDENKRIVNRSNESKKAYTEHFKEVSKIEQLQREQAKIQQNITNATNKYNNILDSINKKKQLGIQLSEQEYITAQKRLQNAKQKVIDAGGRSIDLPLLQDRSSFNKEAMGNYFGGITSKSLFDMDTVTSYGQKMSKLSQILDSATYAWEKSGRKNSEYRKIMIATQAEIDNVSRIFRKLKENAGQAISTTDKVMLGLRTHATWIASSVLASVPLVLPGYAIRTMKELESKFATVEQVMPEIEHAHMASLNKDLSEMERMAGLKKVTDEMNTFINIGSKFGVAVDEVIEAGASIGRMYGQGENGVTNTNLLTQQASRIAVADNFPILQATKGLESALSQFNLQTENTNKLLVNSNRIIDVWTLAAHRGSASANDLTQGVQRAGAAAHQAGISFEFLNALIATGVRATGRSGNEIGTSIKSFVNSMQTDKSIKSLKEFGIDVYKTNADGTKSMRSMEDVILDVSLMLQTTEKNTSKLLLTLAGGKYQVSNLTAILKDYKELLRMQGLLNSSEVTGFTDKQIEIQIDTLSRKLQMLSTDTKGLFMNIGQNGGLSVLKEIIDSVDKIVVGVQKIGSEWELVIKSVIALTVAIKGLPFLLNKTGKAIGRFQETWNNYQGINSPSGAIGATKEYFSTPLKNGIQDGKIQSSITTTNKAMTQNEAIQKQIPPIVAMIDKNYQAMNKTISKTSPIVGLLGNTTVKTAGSLGVLNTAGRVMSGVFAGLGGPVGIAIFALTTLIPLVLDYAESLGEEAKNLQEVIDKDAEKASRDEEQINRLKRSSESAESLARKYNELKDSMDSNSNSTSENAKKEAILQQLKNSMISLIGEENVVVDENGRIKIDTIEEVAKLAEKRAKEEANDRLWLMNQRVEETKQMLENTKLKLKAMVEETKGIGLLSKAYAGFAQAMEWYHSSKKMFYEGQKKINPDKSGLYDSMINTENNEIEYWKKQKSVENTNEYQQTQERIASLTEDLQKAEDNAFNAQIHYNEIYFGDTSLTGGADSTAPNGTIEQPEEKGNSKVEKEAEKLARQQEAYSKAMQKATMSAVMTAENYSERPTNYILNGSFGVGTATDEATSERASYIVNEFLKRGYNLEQATGILGNFIQESNLNTSIESQDGHESYGLGQWTAERRKALIDYANVRQANPNDINVQIDFTDHEIKNGQIMARQGVDWNNRFMNATTPEEASYAFGKGFERPNDYYANWENRQAKARQAYDYYNNGDNIYTTKSETSLGNDAGLVYNVLKNIGMDNEKLNLLGNDIPSIINALDSMGANLSFANSIPTTGDILYTQDGKAFVVNEEGYIGVNGTKGDNWKNIEKLSNVYTSKQYAMGLTLENAKEAGNKIKVSDEAQMFTDYVINKDNNTLQKRLEDYDKKIKYFDRLDKDIANRRTIYGEYDFESLKDEYRSLKEKLDVEKVNAGLIKDMQSEYKQAIDKQFNKSILKQKLTENGFNNWEELSDKTLNDLVSSYSNVTGNKDLKDWINAYKTLSERADEATIKVEEATLALKQAQGIKTPEQALEDNLKNIERQTALWKSSYAQMYGSYDGIEWQSNKREHSDTLEQIKLYKEELARLNTEREKYIKSGINNKAYFEKLSNTITETQTKVNEAVKKAKETGDDLTKANKETIAGMLHDLIKGGSSFKEVWTNIWNDVASVALKRLMGIQDATSEWWSVISNALGFGRNKLNIAESEEAGRTVDKYNIDNNNIGKYASGLMPSSERVKYKNSTAGVVDFYNNKAGSTNNITASNTMLTASQNILLASQNMLQAEGLNQGIVAQEVANTVQDSANVAQKTTTANTEQMAIEHFSGSVGQFGSITNSLRSTTVGGGINGTGDGGFNWIGMLPGIIGMFSLGGYIPKFASGGNTIINGGKIEGAGTGTSDSILAYLAEQDKFIGVSNGEYIMNAKATRKYGNILEQMNLDKFATGGSIAPEPYIPTLKNPNVANNIIKQEVQKQNNNVRMEELLGQQNLILTNIAKQDNSSGGNVTILNTRASKDEIFGELAKDPRALQRLLYGNQKRGFK